MPGVLFLDLAPNLCGWCGGDGSSAPVAGAFRLKAEERDLGRFLLDYDARLEALIRRFDPDLIGYEAPIMGRFDKLWTVRRIYPLGAETERWSADRPERFGLPAIPVVEVNLRSVKNELAGFQHATKADMVAAALKVGIALPEKKDDGREDAADAFGGWLVLLRETDRRRSAEWDGLLYGRRGALL